MEAADGAKLEAAVEQRLHAGTKSVTIELDQLTFINFGGIRAVLKLARSLTGSQRKLDFVGGGEHNSPRLSSFSAAGLEAPHQDPRHSIMIGGQPPLQSS